MYLNIVSDLHLISFSVGLINSSSLSDLLLSRRHSFCSFFISTNGKRPGKRPDLEYMADQLKNFKRQI